MGISPHSRGTPTNYTSTASPVSAVSQNHQPKINFYAQTVYFGQHILLPFGSKESKAAVTY